MDAWKCMLQQDLSRFVCEIQGNLVLTGYDAEGFYCLLISVVR